MAPVEFMQAWPLLLASLALSGLFALPPSEGYLPRLASWAAGLGGSVLVASFLFPALLPLLPFKAFALKGALLGLLWGLGFGFLSASSATAILGLCLVSASISAFIGMGFTGASTFTSQGGAALEVEKGLLPMSIALVLGIASLTLSRLFGI